MRYVCGALEQHKDAIARGGIRNGTTDSLRGRKAQERHLLVYRGTGLSDQAPGDAVAHGGPDQDAMGGNGVAVRKDYVENMPGKFRQADHVFGFDRPLGEVSGDDAEAGVRAPLALRGGGCEMHARPFRKRGANDAR